MANLDWQQLADQRPRVRATESAMTIAALARRAALETPTRIAIHDADRAVDFATLYADAEALAASLWDLGLRPGDVLSFQLPNWAEAAVVNVAACLCGLVCNPVVPIYRDAELCGILGDCRSRIFFVPGEWRGLDYGAMAERVAAQVPSLEFIVSVRGAGRLRFEEMLRTGRDRKPALPEVDPDSVKLVMYTSGTTGPAKGVLHSHRTLPLAIDAAVRRWGWAPGDTLLMPSPVTHITGYCIGLEMPLTFGTSTVLMERWNAADAVRLVDAHGVAGTIGATPFLQELCEVVERTAHAPLRMKCFPCGGAAVPAELIARAGKCFEGYSCRVYGSTEAPLVTYGRERGDDEGIGGCTDGRISCYDVRIVDAEERDLPEGTDGEILVRGAGMFLGYANPANTCEAFTGDGFFRTGDIGFRADDGTLTITGRKKDLIIRGGENISAKEIEDVLHQHPRVVEAAVVSAPHARLGETLAVYLRTCEGAVLAVEELKQHVLSAGLAPQKCPEHVRIIAAMPRTPSGKIRKDVLRGMIRDELSSERAAQSS